MDHIMRKLINYISKFDKLFYNLATKYITFVAKLIVRCGIRSGSKMSWKNMSHSAISASPKPILISIDGLIGSGKSTLKLARSNTTKL